MRYLKYVILLILFVVFFLWLHKNDDRVRTQEQKLLHNDVTFTGEVVSIKISHNHSFGIIFLKLGKSNTNRFDKSIVKGKFPYRIYGTSAELYTHIPDGIAVGDVVSVISNRGTAIYSYKNPKQQYEGFINIIMDPNDIEFIKGNVNTDHDR